MSEFDKWYESWQGWHEDNYKMNKMSFQAGAQSKQSEIDGINRDLNHAFATVEIQQAEIDEYKEVAELMEGSYLREKAKVDELLKRIDKSLSFTEDAHSENWQDSISCIINILKGTTNEQ